MHPPTRPRTLFHPLHLSNNPLFVSRQDGSCAYPNIFPHLSTLFPKLLISSSVPRLLCLVSSSGTLMWSPTCQHLLSINLFHETALNDKLNLHRPSATHSHPQLWRSSLHPSEPSPSVTDVSAYVAFLYFIMSLKSTWNTRWWLLFINRFYHNGDVNQKKSLNSYKYHYYYY